MSSKIPINSATSRITVPSKYVPQLKKYIDSLKSGLQPDTQILVLSEQKSIQIATGLAIGYSRNKRTRLMDAYQRPDSAIKELRKQEKSFLNSTNPQTIDLLLGYTGTIARIYWGAFDRTLKFPNFWASERHQPSVGSLCLNWLGEKLIQECAAVLEECAIAPDSQGILHKKLAADLAFIFEAQISDSILIKLINLGQITLKDFSDLESLPRRIETLLDEEFLGKMLSPSQGGMTCRDALVAESKKLLLAIKGVLKYEPMLFRAQ